MTKQAKKQSEPSRRHTTRFVLTLALSLFLILLIGVGATLTYYYGYYLLEYREIPVDFGVEARVAGLNTDVDALHFGTLSPGGTSQRHLIIASAKDARLVIKSVGETGPYVFPDQNNLDVSAGEPVNLTFTAAVPTDILLAKYTGVVKFYFYRR